MTSQVTIATQKISRRRWAAIGFLLIVSLLVISWFIAPPLIDWLKHTFRPFVQASKTIKPLQLQLAFTLVVFVILGAFAALIVTVFAPKKKMNVSEKALTQERLDEVKYQRKARKRQRTLNREMREYVQSKDATKKK
jgi:hypothetical protein